MNSFGALSLVWVTQENLCHVGFNFIFWPLHYTSRLRFTSWLGFSIGDLLPTGSFLVDLHDFSISVFNWFTKTTSSALIEIQSLLPVLVFFFCLVSLDHTYFAPFFSILHKVVHYTLLDVTCFLFYEKLTVKAILVDICMILPRVGYRRFLFL